ncbi:DUF2087 domain-containing protein [Staphylococcus agnetis]|uniref:DUF2087 domain-containing protein n=1 Tax=Staphylococcus agnetis TaxID=985762 RepID=UPI00208EC11D|nr:DUF2087 domain-containing protein [Staphylococcus agnetis]MCO4346419.1 DUF2087 domain-containing protein [Staphylococcus agnetis]MCO4355947.1 DUF2087 domain-containing protein [Staphylococcus agnetis]MCO4360760.1 DUF2087 domain-containing protein [Staphylococcus agnetis]MCO4365678.1 DUF2087 domain-containing protein [Staphylococcus agnetis]MCO4372438.1 DUF2087 domain-containing protein [Staphylococcus agnetis]
MDKIKERFIKNNRIQVIPRKEKDKKALMEILALEFEKGKIYTEKEINEILKSFYDDYVLLRRYMIDYSLSSRDKGGKEYQLIVKGNNEDIQ